MNIVGIAGLPRSGKDTLAELFIEKGYFGVSLGDIVRDEARKRHAKSPDPISVKNMTETANYLRSQNGADFALKEALARFEEAKKDNVYKGLVVFSVRAPIEADYILKNGGKLIWVEARDKVRYERSKQARREGEAEQTLKEMLEHEKLQETPQADLTVEVQMNTRDIRQKATDVFENNGNDIDSFRKNAQKTFGL